METNLAEEFRKIIDNMSDEELEQKLKELEPLHNIGPKADEYLKFLEENKQKFNKKSNNMDIIVEYKTPENGSAEHKELDSNTEIKFIPDYELLDEGERKDLIDYFEKINGFPESYIRNQIQEYKKNVEDVNRFYNKYCMKCTKKYGEVDYNKLCREGCEFYKKEFCK